MCDQETNQESVLYPDTPILKDVLIIFFLSSILLVVFGSLLQELHLLTGLVISELAFIVAPSLLYTVRYKYNLSQTFHISPITFKIVWLTVVTTAAAFVLIGVVATLQEMVFPRSQDYQEIWEQVLRQFHQIPFILTFILVSILPGICEELFFRGFLLRGFRRKYSDWFSIVVVGILFGVFHLDPYRFFPVTLLGILFGYIVVKTGSIFTGMIAHITNNTIAISISYVILTLQEYDIPPPEDISLLHKIISLIFLIVIVAIALTVFIAGLRALPQISESKEQGIRFETQETNFKNRKPQNEE
jgi:membrane protease YdiL (CAAX protease family)